MRVLITLGSIGVLAATAGPVRAVDGGAVSGEASLTTEFNGPGSDNAKYREYWYSPRTAPGQSQFGLMPAFALSYEPFAASYVDVRVGGRTGIGLDGSTDGIASVTGGTYGKFKASVSYKRIGHTFAYDSQTLYTGVGTGTLLLDDAIQGKMQNSSTILQASNLQDLVSGASSVYTAGASDVDLGLRRDQVSARFEWTAPMSVATGVDVSTEQRKGTRPYGGMFGFSDAIEIPEPIDYRTINVGAHATWADKVALPAGLGGLFPDGMPAYASLSYAHSAFTNNIPAVQYDNPLRLTQTVTATVGQNALPPDNSADMVGLSLGTALPYTLHLDGSAHVAQLNQNADFLPPTVNTYITVLPLPRASLEGKVFNSLYEASLSARPAEKVHVKAEYAYREHHNKTEEFSTPQVVNYDSAVATSATTENVSSIENEVALEQSVEVANRTTLTLKLVHGVARFEEGTADLMTENRAVLSVDSRSLEWATVRVSGERGLRQSDYPSATASSGENPWARKFYAASRDQDKLTAMVTVTPSDDLTLSLEQMVGADNYPESLFGLQNASHLLSSVGVDYRVSEQVTLGSFYTQETYASTQKSRQWNPGAISDPYGAYAGVEDFSNWTADSTDVVRTLGVSSDVAISPKLGWRLEGQYSQNDGAIAIASPVGTTPFDNNPFLPQSFPAVDATRGATLGTSFSYQLAMPGFAKQAVLVVGYRYDVWKIDDYKYEGWTPVATTVLNGGGLPGYNSLLSMGTLPKDYEVHTGYFKISTTF